MRNVGILLLLLISVLTLSSCHPLALVAVGGAAGVGGYQYYQDKGFLEARIYHPYRAVWDATLRALEDLGYAIESAQQEPSIVDLPARHEFLKNQGLEPVARGIKSRSQTRRPGTNYNAIVIF